MKFIPYLYFNGNCAEAIEFYARLFKAQITERHTFGDMPSEADMPPLSEADKQKIMHAQLTIGSQVLMLSDVVPELCATGSGYQKPQGLQISISLDTPAEGQRIFNALAEGGTIEMPFEATFFSKGFGIVTDRFGIPWSIDSGDAELSK
ncbi:VOC family protein [Neisseria dumasiana]|uniref:PhnB-like domain-containing protein n=1 Tax=Neisseria dumasiana TaxID=1931275 RepID=A0ABX3WKC0_9NEIS|nr:VOC family protein [Neisseria dumasiana]OSI34168.1 hypothetical protein BV913_07585 [Neisseria dumasiana]UOO84536.1 VOC family protein [Neisseria dumasiana]